MRSSVSAPCWPSWLVSAAIPSTNSLRSTQSTSGAPPAARATGRSLEPTPTPARVLSTPRDLFVYEPACKERKYVGTGVWPAQSYPPGAIIDGALNIGGPTCAVKTVEDLTGVKR